MRRESHLYQIKVGPGREANELVVDLTHAAWAVLAPAGEPLDSHRWTSLHGLFLKALKGRLVHYAGCGEREECRMSLKAEAGGTPFPAEEWAGSTPVLTLEAGRELGRFVRLLAGMACCRFRPEMGRRALTDRTAEAMGKVFEGRTFVSDACAACSARKGLREKRLWPEAARSVS